MQAVQRTAETGERQRRGNVEECCKWLDWGVEKLRILCAEWSRVRAMEYGMIDILYNFLAPCCAVRAHPLLPCLALPPARLLGQPVRPRPQLRQRPPPAAVLESGQILWESHPAGAATACGSYVSTCTGPLRCGQLLRNGSFGRGTNASDVNHVRLPQINPAPEPAQSCRHLSRPRLLCQCNAPSRLRQMAAVTQCPPYQTAAFAGKDSIPEPPNLGSPPSRQRLLCRLCEDYHRWRGLPYTKHVAEKGVVHPRGRALRS